MGCAGFPPTRCGIEFFLVEACAASQIFHAARSCEPSFIPVKLGFLRFVPLQRNACFFEAPFSASATQTLRFFIS